MNRSLSQPAELSATIRHFGLILLCLALVADGFDTAALAFALPAIGADWGVGAADLTLALVATSVGAVLGYVCSGRLCARWGRTAVVWRAVVIFSLATFVAGFVGTPSELAAARFVSGIGFGLVLPAAVALAGDLVAPRFREAGGMFAVIGVALGTTIGGFVGGPLIEALGWRAAFVLPAILSFGLVAALLAWIRSVGRLGVGLESDPADHPGVRQLFAPPIRAATLLLWATAVLVFASLYELQSWLPTLVVDLGVEQHRAPVALAALGIGGVLGVALAAALIRAGLARVLVGVLAMAASCLLLVGLVPLPETALFVVVAGAGAGLVATTAGLAAIALRIYPHPLRATGIGWAAALGRIGSVVGPARRWSVAGPRPLPRDDLRARRRAGGRGVAAGGGVGGATAPALRCLP